MANNFIQTGDHIDITAAAAIASGDGVLVGSMFGVASTSAANGEALSIAICGVFELPKLEAQAWTVGARVYWDNGNSRCTTVASGNTLIGVATEAAADPSTVGRVRLNGSF